MNTACRRDRKSEDATVAGASRSPLRRLLMRSDFFKQSKNHELLAPSASDCAWSGSIAKDQRRRSRLEAECLAGFNQPAVQSTYRRGKTVRTTRATANRWILDGIRPPPIIIIFTVYYAPLPSCRAWVDIELLSGDRILVVSNYSCSSTHLIRKNGPADDVCRKAPRAFRMPREIWNYVRSLAN